MILVYDENKKNERKKTCKNGNREKYEILSSVVFMYNSVAKVVEVSITGHNMRDVTTSHT